jgi:probable HAF family extracellular repeat protein
MHTQTARTLRAALHAALLSSSVFLAGCDEPTRTPAVASLEITASAPFVDVGDTLSLAAGAKGASGEAISGAKVTWRSSSEEVARVDAGGVVRGVAVGTATITATAGKAQDTLTVTVELPVAKLQIYTEIGTLATGVSTRLRAFPMDSSGRVISHSLRWSTSDAAVAVVSDSGDVRGVGPGQAVITVRAGSQSAQLPLEVVRPYTLTYLGTLEGGSSKATAINELGQVAGTVAVGGPGGTSRAFLWKNGEMVSLGEGEAWGIDDSGRVVGSSGGSAVVWENGQKTVLYTKKGGTARATAINRNGEVAGYWRGTDMLYCGTGGRCQGTVFVVRGGAPVELFSATNAEAWGLNDQGWVTGSANVGGTHFTRSYVYRDGARTELPGAPQTFSGGEFARDVNNRGEIVGYHYAGTGPLIWKAPDFAMASLPRVPFSSCGIKALGNNHRGDAVGTSNCRGVLWRDGKGIRLDFVVGESEWVFVEATEINERGQIVGWGYRKGSSLSGPLGALLLTPPQ